MIINGLVSMIAATVMILSSQAMAQPVAGGLPTAAKPIHLIVKVNGANSSLGEIGCSLFDAGDAFPMDASRAKQIWQAANVAGVSCRFEKVMPGTYAVAIGHDLNGNKRVDTNFLGIPKEGWGVSNNIVPSLRAPKFDEAKFEVKEGVPTELEIKLVY